ncbi:NYN domain protein [Caulifigura coniformis]|uniref:NYN domain protein n=1 Tax=Caulifigura coniformis TaxID=2527983 RepID=A0A517SIN5_9PLAN|nr:NYN domain-containing protein [Caulifigura coniformis]QDT56004.1 NYN domain protein [Caulifigura coniformis]
MAKLQANPGNAVDDQHLKLAVLIDADNANAGVIDGLLAEIAAYGEATVKRIYGDFTAPTSAQWKKVLNRYAIRPVQQFAYTTGKNATDSMLIIDAMDLLYTRRFDGFCLVSSDSDFTGLALRIREEGLLVFGFGEQKTPEAFRNACHKFITTEILKSVARRKPRTDESPAKPNGADAGTKPATAPAGAPAKDDDFPTAFMRAALDQAGDDTGWASLSTFGNYLNKLQPDFDSRLYGFKKLSDLVKAKQEIFELRYRKASGMGRKTMYLRGRKSPPQTTERT